MGTMRDRMEATAQHVLASRQARMQAASDVRAHVAALLSTYRRDRQAMASTMNAAFEQSRRSRAEASRAESDGTKRMIRSFHRARTHAAMEQHTSLASDRHNRSRSVAILMDKFGELHGHNAQQLDKSLKAFVHETQVEVSNLIKRARTSRKKMGREMTQELRRATGAIRHEVTKAEMETRNLMTHFSGMRRNMARRLEHGLASDVQERRQAVDELLDGFRSSQSALQKDIQGAHKSWQTVSKTRTAKHSMAHTEAMKAPEGKKVVPEMGAEKKKAAKPKMAEMSHDHQVAEIFKIIRRHPEGISAGQIGEGMGLSALQVGRLATELAARGKVRKDETTRRYFP